MGWEFGGFRAFKGSVGLRVGGSRVLQFRVLGV